MAIQSSILAWEIPWTEEPGRYSPWDRKSVGHNLATKQQQGFLFFLNVVYHIDLFSCVEESLHPWDKSHLVMLYDSFNVLLDSVY